MDAIRPTGRTSPARFDCDTDLEDAFRVLFLLGVAI
jgi:hypothetical protein